MFTITTDLRRVDGSTWFPGLVADVDPRSCDRAFAYIPDIGWGMLVYDFHADTAWRLEHHYFYFDPLATVFNFHGIRVEWFDGVFGLALSERHPDGYRTLYFQALASTRMFSVDTRVLQQSNSSMTNMFDEYRHLGHRAAGMQAASMSMDEATGAVFYALVNQDAIGCWNPRRSAHHSNKTTAIAAQDSVTLQFPADLKVDFNSNLWVLSDRMPLFRYRVHEFDVTDVNYRVFRAPVADVVKGTVCEPTWPYDGAAPSTGSNVLYNGGSGNGNYRPPQQPPKQSNSNASWNFPPER